MPTEEQVKTFAQEARLRGDDNQKSPPGVKPDLEKLSSAIAQLKGLQGVSSELQPYFTVLSFIERELQRQHETYRLALQTPGSLQDEAPLKEWTRHLYEGLHSVLTRLGQIAG